MVNLFTSFFTSFFSLQPFYSLPYFSHKKQRNRSAVTNLRKMKTYKYFEQYEAKHDAIWFILWFDLLSNFSRRNGAVLINIYKRFLKFYLFLLIKKAEDGFRRLLTPFWLLSLIPLNKNFDFQGSLWTLRTSQYYFDIIGFSTPWKSGCR